MSEIEEFDRIATDIRQILTNQPSHPNALELYGLYKQATVGDVNIGLSKDQAKLEYITTGKRVLSEILSQSMDLFSMAQTVKGVLPQVPIDVIRRDLVVTNNVDETITRLLDGTVCYDAEVEVVASVKEEPAKKPVASPGKAVDKEAASAGKEASQANQSSPVKTENELKTISPMTFSTKAATFEKDPQLRMKSYQERKKQLLEIARAHYIEKHGLNQ